MSSQDARSLTKNIKKGLSEVYSLAKWKCAENISTHLEEAPQTDPIYYMDDLEKSESE